MALPKLYVHGGAAPLNILTHLDGRRKRRLVDLIPSKDEATARAEYKGETITLDADDMDGTMPQLYAMIREGFGWDHPAAAEVAEEHKPHRPGRKRARV